MPAATDSYAQAVLEDKPIGYWRLAEQSVSDTVKDESDNRLHGSIKGEPILNDQGALAGVANPSMTFRQDAFVEVQSKPELSIQASGSGLTVEVWMRPDELAFPCEPGREYVHWLGKGEHGKQEWGFRFYSNTDPKFPNRISAYAWNLTGDLGAGDYHSAKIEIRTWLHFVACFDHYDASAVGSRGVVLYTNGERGPGYRQIPTFYLNPGRWHVVPDAGDAPLRIGTRSETSFLHGGIDEVAIYPYVLGEARIKEHFRAGTGA